MAQGSLGPEEEAAVWKGWTAFSSRAFQNLPGASLKQREEAGREGDRLPVGMLEAKRDPARRATCSVRPEHLQPCGTLFYSEQ